MLRFKKSDGSDYPEWESMPFMSLIIGIISFRGRTPKRLGMEWAGKETDYIVLSALNVKNGFIDFVADSHYGTKELYDKWMGEKRLHKGQVLFTTEAPMGNVAQVPDDKPYILGQRVVAFSCDHNLIDDNFLGRILSSRKVQKELSNLSTGETAKGVSQKSLSRLEVSIPTSLEEQKKIADCLSSIETVIVDCETQVRNMQNQKKGVIQKLFSQEVRFKADDGSSYPDWNYKLIGELYSPIKGATLSKADITDEGTPFILYGELYTTYNEVAVDIVRKTDKAVDEKYYSTGDDVVIPISGETPEGISTSTCVVPKGVVLAGDLNIYRNKDIDGRFFSYVVNHVIKNDITRIAQGASIVHIKAGDVAKIKIPVPCREEQSKIADCLSSFDEVIEDLQRTAEHWKAIKKGLLQQLFV